MTFKRIYPDSPPAIYADLFLGIGQIDAPSYATSDLFLDLVLSILFFAFTPESSPVSLPLTDNSPLAFPTRVRIERQTPLLLLRRELRQRRKNESARG